MLFIYLKLYRLPVNLCPYKHIESLNEILPPVLTMCSTRAIDYMRKTLIPYMRSPVLSCYLGSPKNAKNIIGYCVVLDYLADVEFMSLLLKNSTWSVLDGSGMKSSSLRNSFHDTRLYHVNFQGREASNSHSQL